MTSEAGSAASLNATTLAESIWTLGFRQERKVPLSSILSNCLVPYVPYLSQKKIGQGAFIYLQGSQLVNAWILIRNHKRKAPGKLPDWTRMSHCFLAVLVCFQSSHSALLAADLDGALYIYQPPSPPSKKDIINLTHLS